MLIIYVFFGGLPIGEKSPQKEAKSEEIKKNFKKSPDFYRYFGFQHVAKNMKRVIKEL
jgi:hypothetical protein